MANQWLTGSGVPSTGIGQVTDYYRDTVNNLVYYRENAFTWVVVPAFTPSPDGIGTTWLHGATAPLTAQGSDGDYFYEDTHKIVYRKEGATWVAKGSLDFIGVYGVQWGNGLGAPASTVPLNNLPAGSFYLDVQTSNIYFKNPTMVWELKGQLGSSITVVDNVTSTSTTNALSANQGRVLKAAIDAIPAPTAAVTVLDVLTSTSSTSALSANQGKALKTLIDAIPAPTAAYDNSLTVTTKIASYIVQSGDNDGKSYIRMNVTSDNTCTITSLLTKPLTVRQVNTGTTTLVAGSGVTLNGNLVFSGVNDTKTIIPIGSDIYDVVGGL